MAHSGRWLAVAGLVGVIGAAGPGWAADDATIYGEAPQAAYAEHASSYPAYPASVERTHGPLEKLGRGLGNIVTCWLEVPKTIERRYDPDDTASAFFSGTAIGIVRGVVRFGAGVIETVTFPIPIPANYEPLLPPIGPAGRA